MAEKKKKMKIPVIIILSLLIILILAAAAALFYFSANEYRPAPEVLIDVINNQSVQPEPGQPVKVLSFNIGYGSLDKSQDFFMDGGKTVRPQTDKNISENTQQIKKFIDETDWDILFLQEADKNSKRSYHFNQVKYLSEIPGVSSAYALNFFSKFVPYPFPEFIGKVESGLLTLNSYSVTEAARIALPTTFKWPVRVFQLKRCLLVERVPVHNGKDLVLVNLHLEAYDDGEAKTAQTQKLMDILNEEYAKGNYCIAGGDFNQTFPVVDPSLFPIKNSEHFVPGTLPEDILQPGWKFAVDTGVPSARLLDNPYNPEDENTQYYIIDGFIVSPNIEIISVKTINMGFAYSDHNPVYLEAMLQ
ncbi:endonuclease/exonuclease/phosphatase family protein [Brucepastera parasyntrophica]|uniref:endonuclease/exonuclease/phosphatase family protein n=1 Tax=Brucepastera parasyntrophica TaxID=2880008 RepID=UPI00210BFFE7|nr:endonuclease/exonuclease/phosphatase family protein [Brucepastera parasyntrophica]ULQ58937.1 endonuclease/exonuclease/phosphatase family protein [Brucepastera parasyntrophica]